MSAVYNPPFPHRCKIIRKVRMDITSDEPFVDEFADEDNVSDPFEEQTVETEDEQTPETPVDDVMLIYEGDCMAYPKHTTSASGDVITSLRGLAIPVTSDGWVEREIMPMKNDEVYVWRGLQREYGKIADVNAANFGGTEIIWKVDGN